MTVSQKLIDNINYLKKSLNEISVYDLNTYTAIELYYSIANKLNEVIKELLRFEINVSDEVIEQNEKLTYLLGEGLKTEVVKKIDELIKNGTVTDILNVKIFNDINQKVKDLETNKSDKNTIWSMSNMGQDIKQAMTGGSVAVVGKNTVLRENIVNGQVYGEKTNFINITNKNLFDGNFLPYYITGDNSTDFYLTNTQVGQVIGINVKPNTKYSINKKLVGSDNGTYYFKIISFTKTVDEVNNIIKNSTTLQSDGTVNVSDTNPIREIKQKTFTTSPFDKSVFILVGKEKRPYTEVTEGEVFNLQYDSYNGIYNFNDFVKIDGSLVNNKSIKEDKLTFLERLNKNLFDGKFLPYYVSGGGDNPYILSSSNSFKTLVLDIEPNTTYTLLKDKTDIEEGYYYTKIATFLSDKTEVMANIPFTANGSYMTSITGRDTTKLVFTTGENDKSIAITVAKSQNPYVELLKGEYSTFQDNGYNDKYFSSILDYYKKDEVDSKITSSYKNKIIKNTSRCDIILNGNVKYVFERKLKSDINLDTWLLSLGSFNEQIIWEGTDIEAPIKEVNTDDFIGGIHGDEKIESIQFLIDGNLVNETDTIETDFNNLTIMVKSTLFRCNTLTPAFSRVKKLSFDNGKLTITNKLKCLLSDFKVERYTGCGLYSAYKTVVNGYSLNTNPSLLSESYQPNKNLDEGIFYGKGFTVKVKCLEGKTEDYKGSVTDFSNEAKPRFKFYFDSINNYQGKQLELNEELLASFSIEIK